MPSPKKLLYLDQNAWIALAKGAWDKTDHPAEHAALSRVVGSLEADRVTVPLSFTNIYETSKINDPVRRAHLARVQTLISRGQVFRGRRRVLEETLLRHLAARMSIDVPPLADGWFLSDLWIESVGDYTPERFGFEIPEPVLQAMRLRPASMLFKFLVEQNEATRVEGVRRFSAVSAEQIERLETRRSLAAGESFAVRRQAYSAQMLFDELPTIFAMSKRLGLPWRSAKDLGAPLAKSIINEVPILNAERELVVRLEDQDRKTTENDLRDMASLTAALTLATIVVAEKPFMNLARQAGLDKKYGSTTLTDVTALSVELLA